MADIFISYAREDRLRVQPIATLLERRGWSVWWDPNLRYGDDFENTIEAALKAARCVIVVWSRTSIDSHWVKDEAEIGRQRRVLIPLRIDDVERPLGFGQLQTADLIEWDGESAQPQLDKLLDDIGKILKDERPEPRGETAGGGPAIPRDGGLRIARRTLRSRWVSIALIALMVAGVITVGVRARLFDRMFARRGTIVLGVGEFEAERLAPEDEWMRSNTRDSLITIFSKVGGREVQVIAKERIDWEREKMGIIGAAEALGIDKMISGVVSSDGAHVTVDVRIIDVGTSVQEDTFPRTRPKTELIALQNEAAEDVLGALQIKLSAQRRRKLFASRTNDTLEANKLLTESLGAFIEEEEPPTSLGPSSWEPSLSRGWGPAVANAQEAPASDQAAITELLQHYSEALEAKSIDQFATLHLQMDERQRESLSRYFANAQNLRVKISNVDIVAKGDEALATFTRTDEFKEVPSGRPVQLEVRLSSLLTKQDGQWKIRGLKKPS